MEATFLSNGKPVASTLPPAVQSQLALYPLSSLHALPAISMRLGNERYLGIMTDLSAKASAPLQLVVLKSFDQAERSIQQVDRLVLFAGLLAMVLGTVLMMALSHAVTRPLEDLGCGVRAFGVGDSSHLLPTRGTKEVRELNKRLVCEHAARNSTGKPRPGGIGAPRNDWAHGKLGLPTICVTIWQRCMPMPSFPPQPNFPTLSAWRFSDIHTAVYGTTELLESMLIFSRTRTAMAVRPN